MRRAGIGAIKSRSAAQSRWQEKGSSLAEGQLAELRRNLESFRANLQEFAAAHAHEIRKDAAFRVHFQQMCASIGVDPLASSRGFWAELLGVGDFYYELAVQVVEVCLATSHRNGGLLLLDDLHRLLARSRGPRAAAVSTDDVTRAIDKLRVLGSGFRLLNLATGTGGNRQLVQSVPGELSMDQTHLIAHAHKLGSHVTVTCLCEGLGWSGERARRAVDAMVAEGLAWVDDPPGGTERLYWLPSLLTLS